MAELIFCSFRQVSSPSLQPPCYSIQHVKAVGAQGWELGWQWQYLSVAVPFQSVLVRGRERAKTFAFSPSSSWELEKLLLLMGKSQGIILPAKLIKVINQGKQIEDKNSPEGKQIPEVQTGAFAAAGWCLFRLELSLETVHVEVISQSSFR